MIEYITLNQYQPSFLCTWNGGETIQIHSFSTLKKEYGDELFNDDNQWTHVCECGDVYTESFEKMLLNFINVELRDEYHDRTNWQWTYTQNDNMTIQRIS